MYFSSSLISPGRDKQSTGTVFHVYDWQVSVLFEGKSQMSRAKIEYAIYFINTPQYLLENQIS